MQKSAYTLLLITLTLIGYTLFYSSTHPPLPTTPLLSVTSSTTEEASSATTTEPDSPNTLTTKSGQKITVTESNPNGLSLSTTVLTPSGFATNTPLTLETNKLRNFFLIDMNKDSFDELVLTTEAQGSGSYGEAFIYTTAFNRELIPVGIPKITENDTKKGGLFEGYQGHDTFGISPNKTLVQEFTTYTASDTNSTPTGPTKKIYYILSEKNGTYTVTFSGTDDQATSSPLLGEQGVVVTSTSSPFTTITAAKQATSSTQNSLTVTSWALTSSNENGVITKVSPTTQFAISFTSPSKATITTTCSTIEADYTVSGESIRFSNLTQKITPCEQKEEASYSLAIMKMIHSYKLNNKDLTLFLGSKDSLTFIKK